MAIIEIVVTLVNRRIVQHTIQNLQVKISIPNKSDEDCKTMDGQQEYIDASITQQYSFLFSIPKDTQFITTTCQFRCEGNEYHTAKRTFSLSETKKKNQKNDSEKDE